MFTNDKIITCIDKIPENLKIWNVAYHIYSEMRTCLVFNFLQQNTTTNKPENNCAWHDTETFDKLFFAKFSQEIGQFACIVNIGS